MSDGLTKAKTLKLSLFWLMTYEESLWICMYKLKSGKKENRCGVFIVILEQTLHYFCQLKLWAMHVGPSSCVCCSWEKPAQIKHITKLMLMEGETIFATTIWLFSLHGKYIMWKTLLGVKFNVQTDKKKRRPSSSFLYKQPARLGDHEFRQEQQF